MIHPFRVGHRPLLLPWIIGGNVAISVVNWHRSIDIGTVGIALVEITGLVAIITAVVVASPRMSSWTATGQPHTRRLATISCTTTVLAIAATPLAVHLIVTSLPRNLVPGSDTLDLTQLTWQTWTPIASNLAIAAAITMILVAVAGPTIGTLTTLAAITGLAAGAAAGFPFPYEVLDGTTTGRTHPIAAVGLAAIAVTTWVKTGGRTQLARRLSN
jgi:hypothetical protein